MKVFNFLRKILLILTGKTSVHFDKENVVFILVYKMFLKI